MASELGGGKYELKDMLDMGGLAVIHKGWSKLHDEPVAIKMILPHISRDERFRNMFLDEAFVAGRLRHDHIVRVRDYGQAEDEAQSLYLIMDLIDGVNFRKLIDGSGGVVDPVVVARVGADIASALDYAHSSTEAQSGERLEIVHRDVSPRNILVDTKGKAYLTDFGIARARSARRDHTGVGELKGKLSYMSPEQARGGQLDGKTDIYSLGIVLYEGLTGKRPFDAESDEELYRKVLSGSADLEDQAVQALHPLLREVLAKSLAVKPELRYQHASEMRDDLEEYLKEEGGGGARAAVASAVELCKKSREAPPVRPSPVVAGQAAQSSQASVSTAVVGQDGTSAGTAAPGSVVASVASATVIAGPRRSAEAQKTVIDVAFDWFKLHREKLYIAVGSFAVCLLVFLAADTFLQLTMLGRTLSKLVFPPSLIIQTVPPGATVSADGKKQPGRTPDVKIPRLKPGRSVGLRLELDGWLPLELSHVPPAKAPGEKGPQQLTLFFERPMVVSTIPPDGAVQIDGSGFGKAPANHRVPAGRVHELRAMRQGFQPLEIEGGVKFEVENFGKTRDFRPEFWESRIAPSPDGVDTLYLTGTFHKYVAVSALPAGASITLDGAPLMPREGEPLPLLPAGQHTLEARLDGWLTEVRRIEVTEETSEIDPLILKREIGFRAYAQGDRTKEIAAEVTVEGVGKLTIPSRSRLQIPATLMKTQAVFRSKRYETVRRNCDYAAVDVCIAEMPLLPPEVMLTVNSASGIPVEGAEVKVAAEGGTAYEATPLGYTDSQGSLRYGGSVSEDKLKRFLRGSKQGTAQLFVRASGFQEATQVFAFIAGESSPVIIQLDPMVIYDATE